MENRETKISNKALKIFSEVYNGDLESDNNLSLIACAPEILEFLISAFESFNRHGNFSDISPVEINELIKKATTI